MTTVLVESCTSFKNLPTNTTRRSDHRVRQIDQKFVFRGQVLPDLFDEVEGAIDIKKMKLYKKIKPSGSVTRRHHKVRTLQVMSVKNPIQAGQETYPNRNYNRATYIPNPAKYIPPELGKLYDLVEGRIDNILRPEIERVEEELSNYEGFIEDIDAYEQELSEEFEEILNGGNGKADRNGVSTPDKNWLKNLTKDCARLVKEYEKFSDNTEASDK